MQVEEEEDKFSSVKAIANMGSTGNVKPNPRRSLVGLIPRFILNEIISLEWTGKCRC